MDDPRPPEEKHLSLCLWCDRSEECAFWNDEKMEACLAFERRPNEDDKERL